MAILSKRQQVEAKRAARRHQNATATIKRKVLTDTPTGESATFETVYAAIPCHVAPVSDTNPTTRSLGDTQDIMNLRGYAWFPLTWPDARVPVAPGEDPVYTEVQILLGDLVITGGQTWRATTDEDPAQDIPTRKRVRIDRPQNEVPE